MLRIRYAFWFGLAALAVVSTLAIPGRAAPAQDDFVKLGTQQSARADTQR